MKIRPQEFLKINLKKYPEILKELAILTRDNVSADSTRMKESAFYKLIENANILKASGITGYYNSPLTPKAVLLIAEVARTLTSLTEADFSLNQLDKDAIAIAYTLATSSSISTIRFRSNDLGSNAFAVAKSFSNSSCTHSYHES